MKKKNKGFTMIELLAAIVILGLLMSTAIVGVTKILKRAKDNYYEAQLKEMKQAAKSFTGTNRDYLPKSIGSKRIVNLSTLEEKNYINEIKDYSKKKCYGDKSYVQIFKYSKTDYSYLSHLECPNYNSSDEIYSDITPTVDIVLNGNEETSTKATAEIKIKGSNDESIKLVGYHYIVYKDNSEVINSGNVEANFKTTKNINLTLTKYTPGTIKVKVTATNIYGNQTTKTNTLKFIDRVPPICGKATGTSTSWLTAAGSQRTISVECIDEGSGCKQQVYTKKYITDAKIGSIDIYDNDGNMTRCPVNVYIDTTAPVIKINAYKRTSDKNKTGDALATVTTNNSSRIKYLTSYKNTNNDWFNTNYPNGVYYDVAISDNVSLGVSSKENQNSLWQWNTPNLASGDKNVNTLTGTGPRNITGKTDNLNFSLSAEGYRVGNYTASDEAGNTSTVNIVAPLDRTKPDKPEIANPLNGKWTNKDYSIDLTSIDKLSGIASYNYKYNNDKDYKEFSKSNVTSFATPKFTKEGDNTIYIKSCDVAGNCSDSSQTNIKLDKTPPTTPTQGSIGTVSGSNYSASIKETADGSKDDLSGLNGYKYLIKANDNQTPSQNDSSFTSSKSFTRSCGSTYYAWAIATDKAGNNSSVKYLGKTSDGKDEYKAWTKCVNGKQSRSNSCSLKKDEERECSSIIISVKALPAISCPDDQTLASRSDCVSTKNIYNKLVITDATVDKTTIKVSGYVQNNEKILTNRGSSKGPRAICIASSKTVSNAKNITCLKKLGTFDISKNHGKLSEIFLKFKDVSFDVKDWDKGDYRAVIIPDNKSENDDHFVMTALKTKGGTPVLFNISE